MPSYIKAITKHELLKKSPQRNSDIYISTQSDKQLFGQQFVIFLASTLIVVFMQYVSHLKTLSNITINNIFMLFLHEFDFGVVS